MSVYSYKFPSMCQYNFSVFQLQVSFSSQTSIITEGKEAEEEEKEGVDTILVFSVTSQLLFTHTAVITEGKEEENQQQMNIKEIIQNTQAVKLEKVVEGNNTLNKTDYSLKYIKRKRPLNTVDT